MTSGEWLSALIFWKVFAKQSWWGGVPGYIHRIANSVNFVDILFEVFMSQRNLETIGLYYGINQQTQLKQLK